MGISIVRLIVEIIEPFHGRVFDPACGSGGVFVQCAKFVERHAWDGGQGGCVSGDLIDAMPVVRGMAERGCPRYWANRSRWQYRRGELEGSREEGGVIEIGMHRSLLAVHPWCDEAVARAEEVQADGFATARPRGQSACAADLLTLSAECAAPGARS